MPLDFELYLPLSFIFEHDMNIVPNVTTEFNSMNDESKHIYLFGAENRLYVFHKLKDLGIEKYWKGKFPKKVANVIRFQHYLKT